MALTCLWRLCRWRKDICERTHLVMMLYRQSAQHVYSRGIYPVAMTGLGKGGVRLHTLKSEKAVSEQ